MPRLSSLLVGSLVALTLLSACDSEEPTDPSALVGSWSLQSTTDETYVTVNEAQSFVDQSGPQTGSVTFSGAESGTLRYIEYVSSSSYNDARLTSYDPRSSTQPPVRYQLRLAGSSGGYNTLYVSRADGSSSYYESYSSTGSYTYSGGRLTVRALTLQLYSGGGTVTIAAGSIGFTTVPLEANRRTLVRTTTTPFQGDPYTGFDALRYVFEEGNVFRAERDLFPNTTIATEGTWETDGDRLRLIVATEDEATTEIQTFRFAVEDGRLRLGVTAQDCRGQLDCLQNAEYSLGIQGGTLTAYAVESSASFSPSDDEARPARASAPPEVDPRREATVWPRALARPVPTEASAR